MKNLLRYALIALAFATTGMFAQAATDASTPAAPSHQKVVKKEKRQAAKEKRAAKGKKAGKAKKTAKAKKAKKHKRKGK